MQRLQFSRPWLAAGLALLLAAGARAQSSDDNANRKPLTVQPDIAGMRTNHRLILKDGTYQPVRQYKVVGDRVRYMPLDREAEWEELPVDLVDWDATRKWERDHAEVAAEEPSPAMTEAADLDKEEAAARDDEKARMPVVAKGLELPDEDGVFALDTFNGTPELVELKATEASLISKDKRLSILNPMAGQRAAIELQGAHARVHLHVNDPAIYLSLNATSDSAQVISHAMTVSTAGAKQVVNGKHGAQSATSQFAIVRVDERKAVRIVGAIHVSPTGKVTQDENVIPAKAEVLPGKHWLKLTPEQPLTIGDYALIEILSPSDIDPSVWDFRVNPTLGDNPGSLGPIVSQ
ncbi:MAG TPA: hypothetical protein VLZ50_08130 [Terracidiphilus sp.]|nr:hypothetical protein [Terracidiphilus sp.]